MSFEYHIKLVSLQKNIIMREVIYPNVNEALNYILKVESQNLLNDEHRAKPPIVMRPNIGYVPVDSLDYPFSSFINEANDDQFIMTRLQSGRFSLKPNLRNRKFLFRGQSEYFDACVPNLYRTNKSYFLDDMIYDQELYILILSHPLNQLLDLGVNLNGRLCRFEVNLYGIAQHYYNRTSLMDFTSDPMAALFFANTDYDKDNDTYNPVSKGKIGVLYYYELDMLNDFSHSPLSVPRLSTIGLQVFPRSEKQKGFLLNMEKNENMNDTELFPQIHAIKFWQNESISNSIYNRFNKDNECLLFPKDILSHHWKHYNKDKRRVSLQAVRWNKKWNPEESNNNIIKKLSDKYDISVRNYQPAFTEDELHEYYVSIRNGFWQDFCDKIYIPGDKKGIIKESLKNVPKQDCYRWAFEPDIKHTIDYSKGYLLKEYARFLFPD